MLRRSIAACLAAALTGVLVTAASPEASATERRRPALNWGQCPDDIPSAPVDPVVRCASLRLPVDWSEPHGASFDLAVAHRQARRSDQRVGTLVFGPGGPGDSGVVRVRKADRFSNELLDRFDIVSFDPRGVARSGAPRCAPDPGVPKPSMLLTSQADFEATVAYNRALWGTCRLTSPVFDHADTLSTVYDLDALRQVLGERRLTFHGSSYGTLLGQQYAERFPGRVRAIVLEGVFDHSLDVPAFVRTQAQTLQDSFDEFVTWCDDTTDCTLHGTDVRATWADVLARADRGEYAPTTAFEVAALPLVKLSGPNWAGLAEEIRKLRDGGRPDVTVPPMASAVFCADWPVPVRDYQEYAGLVRLAATTAPDVRYGAGLFAVQACLGWPTPVHNPPHRLHHVTGGGTPLLLLNAVHDPRTGYDWATNVATQLGKRGRLVTYEGWGHGSYLRTGCTIAAVDRYLIDLVLPPPGARCAAAKAVPVGGILA
ncbi:alpha/beta hydrolase [Planosporangium sp. 12N6]|uniref:alpha/beta hydrolase n=1 Tax=Planosporangium spinosum TaxID=3402278 RepID=UPI003CF27A85